MDVSGATREFRDSPGTRPIRPRTPQGRTGTPGTRRHHQDAQALCRFHSGVVTYRDGRHRRRVTTPLRQFRMACEVAPGLPRLLALRCLLRPYPDAASSPTLPTSRATWDLCCKHCCTSQRSEQSSKHTSSVLLVRSIVLSAF